MHEETQNEKNRQEVGGRALTGFAHFRTFWRKNRNIWGRKTTFTKMHIFLWNRLDLWVGILWQVLPHKIVWGVICFAYQKRRVEKSYNSERFFNSLNPGGFCIKPRAFGRLKLLVRNNSRFKFVVLVLFLSSCTFLKMLFFFAILLFLFSKIW